MGVPVTSKSATGSTRVFREHPYELVRCVVAGTERGLLLRVPAHDRSADLSRGRVFLIKALENILLETVLEDVI